MLSWSHIFLFAALFDKRATLWYCNLQHPPSKQQTQYFGLIILFPKLTYKELSYLEIEGTCFTTAICFECLRCTL